MGRGGAGRRGEVCQLTMRPLPPGLAASGGVGPPLWIEPSSPSIVQGQALDLNCVVASHTSATITWYKRGGSLPAGHQVGLPLGAGGQVCPPRQAVYDIPFPCALVASSPSIRRSPVLTCASPGSPRLTSGNTSAASAWVPSPGKLRSSSPAPAPPPPVGGGVHGRKAGRRGARWGLAGPSPPPSGSP